MENNKWIKVYNDLITELKKTRPSGPYNKLEIKKYYTNERVGIFGWKYNKHHIEEITISGAAFKEMPEYKTAETIIVDYIEHYLLHYVIVLAETTKPNHGMITPIVRSGMSILDAVFAWDKLVVEACQKYAIEYVPNWYYKLTMPVPHS